MDNEIRKKRPYIPDYGISTNKEDMLNWAFVELHMNKTKNYWISTTYPNGKPHATPVWGIWYENNLYFGGGPDTRKAKNIKNNNNVVAHTESGENVVIIEGVAEIEDDKEFCNKISSLYEKKYGQEHPPPFFKVIPKKILAWTMKDYANTPTKW